MITVYTTPTCAFCHAVKEYFKTKDVKFKEKDLTQDHEASKWVLENTGQLAVPVIDMDNGDIIVGFDKPKIDESLQKKKK
ncbi:MAG: glutathione S-transferase N-terminal domain-containing protein [bacterium]|nr:glutathione S-transferase N-terminal domain-containing protein [bacterium]